MVAIIVPGFDVNLIIGLYRGQWHHHMVQNPTKPPKLVKLVSLEFGAYSCNVNEIYINLNQKPEKTNKFDISGHLC